MRLETFLTRNKFSVFALNGVFEDEEKQYLSGELLLGTIRSRKPDYLVRKMDVTMEDLRREVLFSHQNEICVKLKDSSIKRTYITMCTNSCAISKEWYKKDSKKEA